MRAVAILKDKKGTSQLVSAIAAMFALVALLIVCMAGITLMNQYQTLNSFGDQMMRTVSREGACNTTAVNQRYAELQESTGLAPDITYTADFVNAATKTVQYGETIKMELRLETEMSAVFFSIPITLEISKSGESEQYWK